MKSIYRQLRKGLLVTLLLAAVLLLAGSYLLIDRNLRASLYTSLNQDADTLLAALQREGASITLNDARVPSEFKRPYSGYYYRVETPEHLWRSRSLWDVDLAPANATIIQGPKGEPLVWTHRSFTRFKQPITIMVAQDYSPAQRLLTRILVLQALLMLAGLAALLVFQKWMLRRALHPLAVIKHDIIELQAGKRRQLHVDVPFELTPLVGEINRLIHNTEDTLSRSRSHLSNLGHALKTPLAVLTSLSHRDDLPDNVRASLDSQLTIMRTRIHRELARARLAGEGLPSTFFYPADDLPDLIATLSLIHNQRVSFTTSVEPNLRLRVDREDALELLGNLADNACKWATSSVSMSIARSATGAQIIVEDDGPGIAPEQRDLLQQRGQRLDERVEGHGLGLGIVADIAHHWDAQLTYGSGDHGGLKVVISLPNQRVV